MFQGSVKGTGYPRHSTVSPPHPSRSSPCAITFQLESIFDVVAEGFRVLPDHGFFSDVEFVVVVVDSFQVESGTVCSSGQCSGYQWHSLCCSGLVVWLERKQPGGRQAETETAANRAAWFTGTWRVQTNTVHFYIPWSVAGSRWHRNRQMAQWICIICNAESIILWLLNLGGCYELPI